EAMRNAEGYTFVLNLDEEEITVNSSFVLVALGNGVGGMKDIMPDATLRDGKLHLLALKGDSIAENWTVAPKMLTGNLVEDDRILYRTFSKGHIDIREAEELISNRDGDEGEALPLNIKVLPKHMTFFVPGNFHSEKK